MRVYRTYRIATGSGVLALLLFAALLVGGCGVGSEAQPQCPEGLNPYKGKCLDRVAIQYVGCTEGRGFNVTDEISASVGGSFRVVADASLSVARKKVQEENTPVALQVVKDCLELAKQSATAGPDQAAVAAFQQQVDKSFKEFEERTQQHRLETTASIKLSKDSAHIGDKVTVQGSQFQANETVEISVDLQSVTRVTADSKGSFSTTITIPKPFMERDPRHFILAQGRSSIRSDRLPIEILP
ncbi:MAG TPA: hypothetical protein VFV67_27060 [Actinophytocola sp.]|uniref:hypothetical protein n=1 Tax=Actinophytocola sp. TaxID=1872138 RepID=UPI002DBEF14B|nr:hypothetical protein [Actinophytocola sp.]HEU5474325.1 hypothetical protein [Actinophytocola sp.]